MEKISQVNQVTYQILKSNPPQLAIQANGMVSSSGWGPAQLIARPDQKPSADGIWEIDFLANKPTGIVMPVKRPINASATLEIPAWVQTVKVNAEHNSIEFDLGASGVPFNPKEMKAMGSELGEHIYVATVYYPKFDPEPRPFPFPPKGEPKPKPFPLPPKDQPRPTPLPDLSDHLSLEDAIKELVGRPVRVLNHDEPMPMNYVAKRTNIRLSKDGKTIHSIFFG